MRIAPNLGQSHFYHNPEEAQPLKDLFDIFHGRYICTKTHFGLDQFTYNSDDRYVTGKSIPLGGIDPVCSATDIWIGGLECTEQAARWTTVEVYKHQYHRQHPSDRTFMDFRARPLVLVAPDQRGAPQWANRPAEEDFALETACVGSDPADDTETSLFIARGDTLLAAAHTMVRYYSEILALHESNQSLAELDASMTIAHALGSTSIEHLEKVWDRAMEISDPRVAASQAYQALTA